MRLAFCQGSPVRRSAPAEANEERSMTIELASTRAVEKPWGRTDLRPWSDAGRANGKTGEIWFERRDPAAHEPSLLLKLLFTSEPLSVQVHPGDAFAHSLGEARGKSEAWYVLSAESGSRIALGLDRRLTSEQLREAIADGSIAKRIAWQEVACGDVVDVPAGSIHAIGAGLVIAEIQQRSDTTFRLFDYGRSRALHVEQAVAVADAGLAPAGALPKALGPGRTLLVASSYFILEKIDALPRSKWRVQTPHETWLLLLHGHARVGLLNAFPGEAVFLEDEETTLQAGALGMQALIAYEASSPDIMMVRPVSGSESDPAGVATPPVAAFSAMSQLLSRSALEVRT
jgi:mannose-6-phosphate isomerase